MSIVQNVLYIVLFLTLGRETLIPANFNNLTVRETDIVSDTYLSICSLINTFRTGTIMLSKITKLYLKATFVNQRLE